MANCSIALLKSELRNLGLDTSGTRNMLMARLNASESRDMAGETDARGGLRDLHLQKLHETEGFCRKAPTRIAHKNRLMNFISWLEETYPGSGQVLSCSSDDIADGPDRVIYEGVDKRLDYKNLNVSYLKAFISFNKISNPQDPVGERKYCSFENLRKYKDCVKQTASVFKDELPSTFETEMSKFLTSVRKEIQNAKECGAYEEKTCDPIPMDLYRKMCQWAINKGDMFFWSYVTLQWNLVCRSCNIARLGFHHLEIVGDSLGIMFHFSKANQLGKSSFLKHVYANPGEPAICSHLSLACHLALMPMRCDCTTIFPKKSAARTYNEIFGLFINQNKETVEQYIRVDRGNSHGIRKGGVSSAASGTTNPPDMTVIALRAEWSMGKIFDTYFHNITGSNGGDHYLGRILAGFDPLSKDFATLPAQFNDSVDERDLSDGISITFAELVSVAPSVISPVLRRLLASLVYHANYLKSIAKDNPSHPFNLIAILNDSKLLSKLSPHVSTKSCGLRPSGIPPHIKQIGLMEEIIEGQKEIRDSIESTIYDAIQHYDRTNQIPSLSIINEALDKKLQSLETKIITTFGKSKERDCTDTITNQPNPNPSKLFAYDGKFWEVPEGFVFGAPTRWNAFISWLKGTEDKGVRPFRLIKARLLPAKVRSSFKHNWMPIMKLMEEGVSNDIPVDPERISVDFLRTAYKEGSDYVKSRAAYIYSKDKDPEVWKISTWSRKVKRSAILQNGTKTDKELAMRITETWRNNKRKRPLS